MTSSGPTKSRARVAARAWATLTRAIEPRGEAPRETAGWLRVASVIATAWASIFVVDLDRLHQPPGLQDLPYLHDGLDLLERMPLDLRTIPRSAWFPG